MIPAGSLSLIRQTSHAVDSKSAFSQHSYVPKSIAPRHPSPNYLCKLLNILMVHIINQSITDQTGYVTWREPKWKQDHQDRCIALILGLVQNIMIGQKYHISELDILNVQISLVANSHDGKEKKCKDNSESVQKHMQICFFALFLACSLPCLFIWEFQSTKNQIYNPP